MFFKEIFSILIFSFVTLVFSGFAIKVDKFEYTILTTSQERKEENKQYYWLDMPEENFEKLKIWQKEKFNYFEDRKEKSAKIFNHYSSPINDEKRPRKIKYIRVILVVDDHHSAVNKNSLLTVVSTSTTQSPNASESQKETTKLIKYFVETKTFWANLFC